MSLPSSVPLTSGRPRASVTRASDVELADAVGADDEVAGLGGQVDALADLGRVEADVGVERAASPRRAPASRAG